MSSLASAFKALADPTRLDVLALLFAEGELCVCDVEGALAITQSKSSRHLRYLLQGGLLESRRVGASVYYRIPRSLDPARRELVRTLRRLLQGERTAELRAGLTRYRRARARRGLPCPEESP